MDDLKGERRVRGRPITMPVQRVMESEGGVHDRLKRLAQDSDECRRRHRSRRKAEHQNSKCVKIDGHVYSDRVLRM